MAEINSIGIVKDGGFITQIKKGNEDVGFVINNDNTIMISSEGRTDDYSTKVSNDMAIMNYHTDIVRLLPDEKYPYMKRIDVVASHNVNPDANKLMLFAYCLPNEYIYYDRVTPDRFYSMRTSHPNEYECIIYMMCYSMAKGKNPFFNMEDFEFRLALPGKSQYYKIYYKGEPIGLIKWIEFMHVIDIRIDLP